MIQRAKIHITGAVQGVGFRPFIFLLAEKYRLKGFVYNSSLGVFIEAEGERKKLDAFIREIEINKPERSFITGMEISFLDAIGFVEFEIRESKEDKEKSVLILPDIAVCKDCLKEMYDPKDRRYRYPFINCTNCGPRYSIIESLPYDRANTSMKIFEMCEECKKEYINPLNRRFHAQPIACPDCGPHLELYDNKMNKIGERDNCVEAVAKFIREGKIIALKGLGGFQLIVDARNNDAVKLLRKRKHRDEKPFALMFSSIESIEKVCYLSDLERRLLKSPEAPIVLLRRKDDITCLAETVAPENPYLGIMLPYTPLHHLLLHELKFPVVATSGNISEEPMCISNEEAFEKLKSVADFFLTHNRPILRQVDDSLVRIINDKEMVLRRARGYAPLPINIQSNNQKERHILAVGGHLKNTIALQLDENIFVSQYIGDLSSEEAYKAFLKVIDDFKALYETENPELVCDMHPEYLSVKYVKEHADKFKTVQHHFAHIASCKAENQIKGETLGVSWDGTGFGLDNSIWGGEFFVSDENTFSHVGRFLQFPLPGGSLAIKEARRAALGVLYILYGTKALDNDELYNLGFNENELDLIMKMLHNQINSPLTSSVGRLFDAVSAILGISFSSSFEGQSAMKLEFIVDSNEAGKYPFDINIDNEINVDWRPLIESILSDKKKGVSPKVIAAKFHNTLSFIILEIAKIIAIPKVVLSGGCFQNVYLTEKTIELLTENNFKVYTHQRIPPNDGGISLGQIVARNIKYVKNWERLKAATKSF